MQRVKLLLSMVVGAYSMNVRRNLGEDKIVALPFEHVTDEVYQFLNDIEADSFGAQDNAMHMKLSPDAIKQLKDMNVEFTDTTDSWMDQFEENFNNPNLFCSGEGCARSTMDAFYDQYQSYENIMARVAALADSSSYAVMKTIGQSHEGRDIELVEVGNDGSKPMGLLFCTIHAREWLTPMFCTYLIETLLAGHPLLDNFAFAIVPVANPDGYIYSTAVDNLWRKTRKPNANNRCVGTDGNRNWDNNHCGVGSSTNPCSQVYCGTAPFDQPEVAALDAYTLANLDRIVAMLDIHSYGSYLIHAFGYTEVLPVEKDYVRMRQCADESTSAASSSSGTNWRYGTTPQVLGYTSGGTSKDYFYGNLGIVYSYTVELRGNNFQPNPSNIKPSNNEAFALVESAFSCVKKIEIDGEQPVPIVDRVSNERVCVNLEQTNIFRNNAEGVKEEVSCEGLQNYCSSVEAVKQRCQATCGCYEGPQQDEIPDNGEEVTVSSDNFDKVATAFAVSSFVFIALALVGGLIYNKRYQNKVESGESYSGGQVFAPTV